MLTRLEEYVLSSCDGQNVGARVARDIISRYLGRDISVHEMRKAHARVFLQSDARRHPVPETPPTCGLTRRWRTRNRQGAL